MEKGDEAVEARRGDEAGRSAGEIEGAVAAGLQREAEDGAGRRGGGDIGLRG